MSNHPTRRDLLCSVPAIAGVATLATATASAQTPKDPFLYCLNTSTISGQKVPVAEEVDIAAKAGYQAFEPWTRELEAHVQAGGSLKDLGKRIQDKGMIVPSAIGFAEWIVDDDTRRKKGLEQAKRDMDMVQQIGGTRIAAPPVGATQQKDMNLMKAAERYRALVEVGEKIGVIPQVELWGFSTTLGRLGETALVAIEAGHPKACVLPDVYHLYKGGSDFTGQKLLSPVAIQHFHVNDYPDKPRNTIADADRVYPGDGVAPLASILRDLFASGYRGAISLELFNREYWKQDALLVARTGLEKMKGAVARSFAG